MDEVTILNFGIYLAAPLTARYLQKMGARIITIKPPKQSEYYKKEIEWNPDICEELLRNQEVHYINLKENFEYILPYLKIADVVLNNFRPGVMEQLGLGCEYCKTFNKDIIYVKKK